MHAPLRRGGRPPVRQRDVLNKEINMRVRFLLAGVIPLAVAGSAMAQTGSSSPAATRTSPAATAQAAPSPSMQKLQQSAQQLRESIQALGQKKTGPDRDRAIANAHEALMETQRAMLALPPELRSTSTPSTAEYGASVSRLMNSADSLRQAIQEMAQRPPGEGRDRAIEQAHKALADTQAAMLAAYQTTSNNPGQASNQQNATRKAGAAAATPDASVLVLVPSGMAGDTRFANGCWVRFFDDKQYRGAALTLAGPVDMPKMEVPGGVWRDWDSAVVGPRARVITYDNENFRDRTAELASSQSYPDLRDKKLGWFEEVKSARVSCG